MAILKAKREKEAKKVREENLAPPGAISGVTWSSHEAGVNKRLTEWVEALEEELKESHPQVLEDGKISWPITHIKKELKSQQEEWRKQPQWNTPCWK